jgi:hypothetical protein
MKRLNVDDAKQSIPLAVLHTFTFSPKNPYQAKQTFQLQRIWSSNTQQKGTVSEEVTR